MTPVREYLSRLKQFGPNARLYLAYSFLSGFGFGILRLYFNLYVLSLGFDTAILGMLIAVPPFAIMGTAIPMGLLGARIGFRRALLAGTMMLLLSMVGIAFSYGVVGLVLFSLLRGVSRSLVQVSSAPFMAEQSSPEERTHLFSVQFSVRTFSSFFGFLLAGVLPSLFAPMLKVAAESPAAYRATLLVGAGIFAAALLPLFRLRKPAADPMPLERPRLRDMLPHPGLLTRLLLPQVIIGLGAGALVPFLNVYFKLRFGLSDALLGTLFAAQSVVMGVATLLGPLLAAKLGKVRAVAVAQIVSIPFLLLLGYSPALAPAAVGFLVRASLMNMGNPLYTAFAMDRVGRRGHAATSGLLQMSWQGTRAISSSISGVLQQGPGFAVIFPITIACYLLASILTYVFFGRTREPSPAPQGPETS